MINQFNQHLENVSKPRSNSRKRRYERVIRINSSSDEEIEIDGVTTQDRESEKEKRIAEQNKNKRVKISTGITDLTKNTESMTISSKRVNTVEPVKRSTGPSCRWCYLDICKIHESK